MRPSGRRDNEIRALSFRRRFTRQAPGSVLVSMGKTMVLCTCAVEESVPPFLLGKGQGWLSAEYGMLPGSTDKRKHRDRAGRVDGRSVEIQRLIGRSLRAVIDLQKIGERTFWLDCDVLQADGGTRTASINGAFVALVDALTAIRTTQKDVLAPIREILRDSVAAVSVGVCHGTELLDLDYAEDKDADVDFNLVMTGAGEFVEVQGSGEEATFSRAQLDRLLKLGQEGIQTITAKQKQTLGRHWPIK